MSVVHVPKWVLLQNVESEIGPFDILRVTDLLGH